MPKFTVSVYERHNADVEIDAATREEAEALVLADIRQRHRDGLLAGVDWHLESDGVVIPTDSGWVDVPA